MTGRMLLRLSLMAVVLPLAACGGGGTRTVTVTTTVPATTAPGQTTSLRVYFLDDGRVRPVSREAPGKPSAALDPAFAFTQLVRGPTEAERQLGLTSEVQRSGPWSINSVAGIVKLTATNLSRLGLAQAVFTLTQFPNAKAVEINGKRYTRADFENETPIIAVESPLPFQHVTSPLRATGTANTFEATFEYELTDPEGKIIASHFVTATSGSGTRGTFDFSVPFTVDRSGLGELIVYERSAANGSRIHISEIPIYLER